MIVSTDVDEAISFTLGREGGWYPGDEPRDPNPTMYGVTQTTYDGYRLRRQLPVRSVREIEPTELREIYVPYWRAAGCDLVGKASGITLFDHSINAGPAVAAKPAAESGRRYSGRNDRARMDARFKVREESREFFLKGFRWYRSRIEFTEVPARSAYLPSNRLSFSTCSLACSSSISDIDSFGSNSPSAPSDTPK